MCPHRVLIVFRRVAHVGWAVVVAERVCRCLDDLAAGRPLCNTAHASHVALLLFIGVLHWGSRGMNGGIAAMTFSTCLGSVRCDPAFRDYSQCRCKCCFAMLLYSIHHYPGMASCPSPWQRRVWKVWECMCMFWFHLRSSPAMLTVMQTLPSQNTAHAAYNVGYKLPNGMYSIQSP